MKIEPSIALVTRASSGIGEATAKRLAAVGYKVYGTSRRVTQAGQRVSQMLPLDATRDDSVEAAAKEVMRLEGRIDVLVINAGFGVAPAGAEESSLEQPPFVPHMRRRGAGIRKHHQLDATVSQPRRRKMQVTGLQPKTLSDGISYQSKAALSHA